MRVVLFAWCANATLYLDALCAAGSRPRLVVTGPQAPAQAPLVSACEQAAIALEHWTDVNAPERVRELRELSPELALVAGWPRLFRAPIRAAAKLGFVNAHPSLLPEYRGRDPIFWAIVEGEQAVGVTLHEMTDELDSGKILLQREVIVPSGATFATLSELVDRAGADLVCELIASAKHGALPRGRIATDAGSYFPPVSADSGLLDFTRSAERLERLVRACAGITRAHTSFRGMKLVVLEAKPVATSVEAAPGHILSISSAGIDVAVGSGSTLRISRWLFLERVHDGESLASLLDLAPGARFG